MERKIHIFLIVFMHYFGIADAQNRVSIYNAYNASDMIAWKKTIDRMESNPDKSNVFRLELLNYQYGYIAWCIGEKKAENARKYLKIAENHLGFLENEMYKLTEIYAYKAAFVGYEIGISPYKAPFIGQKSLKYAEKSVNIDSTNALGYIQLGNIKFYSPVVLGGSKEIAIKHYLKALDIMEENTALIEQNWNYLNLLGTIITAYKEVGNYSLARDYCNKALKIAPEFDWVKNKLYPEISESYYNK